jgi:hypothetical protein
MEVVVPSDPPHRFSSLGEQLVGDPEYALEMIVVPPHDQDRRVDGRDPLHRLLQVDA